MSPSPNGPYHRGFLPGRETVLIEQVPAGAFYQLLSQSLDDESSQRVSLKSQRRSSRPLTHAKHSSHVITSHLSMWCAVNAISTQLFGQSKL